MYRPMKMIFDHWLWQTNMDSGCMGKQMSWWWLRVI